MKVERWPSSYARTATLRQVIEAEGQLSWYDLNAEWHRSSHTLAASDGDEIIGFLRFVTQEIGPELDRPPVRVRGVPIIESKVLAFGVVEQARNAGVGRDLQEKALAWSRELRCHQMRSYSSGTNVANHALKLGLGFGVDPVVRDDDDEGAYFVMPLKSKPVPNLAAQVWEPNA